MGEPVQAEGAADASADVGAQIRLDWERNRKGKPANDYVSVKVTGEARYQPALRAICRRSADEAISLEGKTARLVPEPDNPHDHLAVRVEIDGHTVGYMSRGNAKRYHRRIRRLIDAGRDVTVPAWIGCHGPGAENPNLGVRLKIPATASLSNRSADPQGRSLRRLNAHPSAADRITPPRPAVVLRIAGDPSDRSGGRAKAPRSSTGRYPSPAQAACAEHARKRRAGSGGR